MAKQIDKEAIFDWLHSSAEKLQRGVEFGVKKTKEASKAINEKIDKNPKAKAVRDNVSKFAQEKSERLMDMRIGGTRVGDLPNAAQRLTERQLYKIIAKLHEVEPDFDWNQFLPNTDEMPVFSAFECLGLPYGTPFEEVKKTYRKLMREYHPDRHGESPEAERLATEKTQKLTAAYELICQHYGK